MSKDKLTEKYKKFVENATPNDFFKETVDFISSELSLQREAIAKKIEGMKKDVRLEIKVWLKGNRETNEEYNQALTDVLSLINEKE